MNDSEGWTSLRKDLYINRKSTAHLSGALVSLWVKMVPESGSDALRVIREKFMDRGREDQALAYQYTAVLSEIDCSRGRHRELVTIFYDSNKNIMQSGENKATSWNDISAGSPFRFVERAVCDNGYPAQEG